MPLTKTEESIQKIIDEKHNRMLNDVIDRYMYIFIWGAMSGALLAYSSILPVFIGVIVGYSIGKRNIPIVDYFVIKLLALVCKTTGLGEEKLN